MKQISYNSSTVIAYMQNPDLIFIKFLPLFYKVLISQSVVLPSYIVVSQFLLFRFLLFLKFEEMMIDFFILVIWRNDDRLMTLKWFYPIPA